MKVPRLPWLLGSLAGAALAVVGLVLWVRELRAQWAGLVVAEGETVESLVREHWVGTELAAALAGAGIVLAVLSWIVGTKEPGDCA